MFLFQKILNLRTFLLNEKKSGRNIGFVPTMGALHQGHISLIKKSLSEGNLTVCSIFINPTQFNERADFENYPTDVSGDIRLLLGAGCDVLFHPEEGEIYPDGAETAHYDFGALTNSLEGYYRPGHFDGMMTVVRKLLEAVQPDHAYFGQKDYQQCAVVARLIKEFGSTVELHMGEIIRETDGLAMSSRNQRLSPTQKKDALILYQTLNWIRENRFRMNLSDLKIKAREMISPLLKPEYVEIIDPDTFLPVSNPEKLSASVALIAAWCGDIRLIDNMILND